MSTLLTTAAGWITRQQLCAWGPTILSYSSSSPPLSPSLAARAAVRLFSSRTGSGSLDSDVVGAVKEERSGDGTGPTALVFDTETTGMVRFRDPFTDPSQPDLVQLGFLLVDTGNWKIRNQGSFLVRLRDSASGIEEGAQRVHGISEEDCSLYGIREETALDLFENLCKKADVLVGHNIRFDAIVMQTAFYRGRGENDSCSEKIFSSKPQVCTMMESIDLCRLPSKFSGSGNSTSYKWPSLEEAYRFVTGGGDHRDGETLEGAHDALVDSQACLKVFRYLVEHGHVAVESSPVESIDASPTTGDPSYPAATGSEADHRAGVSDDFATTAPSSFQPQGLASALFPDIERGTDDRDILESYGIIDEKTATYGYDADDRNGSIDRSREVEEAAALVYDHDPAERNGGVDRSIEIEEAVVHDSDTTEHNRTIDRSVNKAEEVDRTPPRLFDPAAFSPDMLQNNGNARTNYSYNNNNNNRNGSAGEAFRVSGNTYKHKEMIKQLGGRWNAESKEWVFRETRYLSKLESYADLTIVRSSDK